MGGTVTVHETPNYPASPHLRFIEVRRSDKRVTKFWDVERANSGAWLGVVKWFTAWRRYTFFPDDRTIYDASCLHAIADFCHTQTFERKRERKLERTTTFIDHGVKGTPYGS